jgi:hypothetical protein
MNTENYMANGPMMAVFAEDSAGSMGPCEAQFSNCANSLNVATDEIGVIQIFHFGAEQMLCCCGRHLQLLSRLGPLRFLALYLLVSVESLPSKHADRRPLATATTAIS